MRAAWWSLSAKLECLCLFRRWSFPLVGRRTQVGAAARAAAIAMDGLYSRGVGGSKAVTTPLVSGGAGVHAAPTVVTTLERFCGAFGRLGKAELGAGLGLVRWLAHMVKD